MTKKRENFKLQRRVQDITMPITRKRIKWGRNWPCLCGSGRKYKACCLGEIDSVTALDGNANTTNTPEDVQRIIDAQHEAQKNGGEKNNG